ncbi:phosphatidate cytidylyltransferase [Prolixibacteraceae bacterium Z1-6]|uniref:Phosphatidate cytidylyltransferase n=1 Tax=Draconibacterium aestuarii TaxID=2998507 RepID=A0A9X3FD93_9BACT|nr:phosphatidate cytidylyltransferase [Prolixibacteraceae bacterium Z1-6]
MITTIYIIILLYFILGGIGFYFINRRKEKEIVRKSWTKFIVYFFIIHILFFSIVINPVAFKWLATLIVSGSATELFRLFRRAKYTEKTFFLISVLMFSILAFGFMIYSTLDKEVILFAFLILSIFDAFSQISGQLWGNKKIAPEISPNKTVGGTVGGSIFAIFSSILMKGLYNNSWTMAVVLAFGIVVFAFLGDILASLYKRKFGVKDYSHLIPGHGGVLDRFDSLIAGGAWVALFVYGANIL